MIHTFFSKTAVLATIGALALSASAKAQDADVIDLNDLTCRTYLTLGGDERDMTTIFLHGYFTGQADMSSVNISDLATTSDQVLVDCIDGPDKKVLEVFGAALK